ncbi:MAG TPA: NAD(P)H-dependent glycerol-3-phosphate dehydrogenase, partial [Acidimicrobiales bacterium]
MPQPLCVLGAGSWGTAIAALANGDVRLWSRRAELAAEINDTRHNARYTGDLELPSSLTATSSLADACSDAVAVLIAVPSAGFRTVAQDASGAVAPGVPVFSLTKGIERGTNATMTEVLRACLSDSPVGVVTGPNLAKEIALGMP